VKAGVHLTGGVSQNGQRGKGGRRSQEEEIEKGFNPGKKEGGPLEKGPKDVENGNVLQTFHNNKMRKWGGKPVIQGVKTFGLDKPKMEEAFPKKLAEQNLNFRKQEGFQLQSMGRLGRREKGITVYVRGRTPGIWRLGNRLKG